MAIELKIGWHRNTPQGVTWTFRVQGIVWKDIPNHNFLHWTAFTIPLFTKEEWQTALAAALDDYEGRKTEALALRDKYDAECREAKLAAERQAEAAEAERQRIEALAAKISQKENAAPGG